MLTARPSVLLVSALGALAVLAAVAAGRAMRDEDIVHSPKIFSKRLDVAVFANQERRAVHGVVADVDRDGVADVVVLENDRVVWYRNMLCDDWHRDAAAEAARKRPTVATFTTVRELLALPEGVLTSITPADIDADGDDDLVVAIAEPKGRVMWLENLSTPPAPGEVGGQVRFVERVISPSMDHALITVADLDNDGDVDVIVNSVRNAGLHVCLNQHQPSRPVWFACSTPYRPAQNPFWMHAPYVIDVDGDGLRDIVLLATTPTNEILYLRNGLPSATRGASSIDFALQPLRLPAPNDIFELVAVESFVDVHEGGHGEAAPPPSATPTGHVVDFVVENRLRGRDGRRNMGPRKYFILRLEHGRDAVVTRLAGVLTLPDVTERMTSFVTVDLDLDEDADVIMPSNNQTFWCRFSHNGPVRVLPPMIDGPVPPSVAKALDADDEVVFDVCSIISTSDFSLQLRVAAADLDGDGDVDVLSTEVNRISWFKNRLLKHEDGVRPDVCSPAKPLPPPPSVAPSAAADMPPLPPVVAPPTPAQPAPPGVLEAAKALVLDLQKTTTGSAVLWLALTLALIALGLCVGLPLTPAPPRSGARPRNRSAEGDNLPARPSASAPPGEARQRRPVSGGAPS